jgi:hypothetical protein
MTRLRVPLVALAVVLLAGGCARAEPGGAAASSPDAATSSSPSAAAPTATPPAPTADSEARPTSQYRVTYGWAVPSRAVRVIHAVRVPVAPPPAPPLPLLTEVRTGDHPSEDYTRITFAFRGAMPSYEVAYVRRVDPEGAGDPLPLTGNAFLRIRFEQAQAHEERGRPSVATAARTPLTYPTLRSYGFGGDFEGYVTYGLGIRVAPGSDQVLPIRVGELVRADGSHVVAVDVRRG